MGPNTTAVRLRLVVLALAGVAAALAFSSSTTIKAQSEPWTPEYPLILNAQHALALVRAADQKLDYVPGEVLVKFKAGVTSVGQERALDALRSRPTANDMEWHGDVALVRDPREPDATILAAQLASEPEVEYAQ